MMATCTTQSKYQQLLDALPTQPLYGNVAQQGTGWPLSPQPYQLSPEQAKTIEALGPALQAYLLACQTLFTQSQKQPELLWLKTLFEKGKPDNLITFSQMKRFKPFTQLVIRPDLLVTPTGLKITEVDTCPGGIGFTAALQKAYAQLGHDLIGVDNIAQSFIAMLLDNWKVFDKHNEIENPSIAVVINDDFNDYRQELSWLVSQIQYEKIAVIHPKQLSLRDRTLGYLDDQQQFTDINMVYRMFELYDLPNIPQVELLQYAIKKGLVHCTPPFKPYLEEKFCLALIHAPALEQFWQQELPAEAFAVLKDVIPESWLMDKAELPFQAFIEPALRFGNKRHQNLTCLGELTQKERELVLKPSSFSRLAWGSHGITIGHDVNQTDWKAAVDNAMSDPNLVYLLQRFENTAVEPYQQYDDTGAISDKQGRTRLCPYYFVTAEKAELVGVLATTCPKDKKIIHGMRDGVMRPAMV